MNKHLTKKSVIASIIAALIVQIVLHFGSVPAIARNDLQGLSRQAACADVKFITRGQASALPQKYRAAVVDPGPSQELAARLAMGALPDLMCKAVEGIAFVNLNLTKGAKALVNMETPDVIIVSAARGFAGEEDLNVKFTVFQGENSEERAKNKLAADLRVWPETIQAIMHESAHCSANLINSVAGDAEIPAAWEAGAVAAAKEAIERTRLYGGLTKEWVRINKGFKDADLGGAYDDSRLQDASVIPPAGFFTMYGGNSPGEDIAETASWIAFEKFKKDFTLSDISTLDIGYFPSLQPAFPSRNACEKMAATDGIGIPGDLASVFTKASFLVDLGMAESEALESCKGAGKLGLKRTGDASGFEVFRGSDWKIINEYKRDLTMLRKKDEVWIAAVNAIEKDGKQNKAILELSIKIEDDGYPRGLYRINRCEEFLPGSIQKVLPDADAYFGLLVEDVRSNSFCAFTALVLVTRARRGLIEGAVVLQRLVKFSTPPVPERPDPPIQYTFVIK